jgi:hypothetical protein
MRIRVFRHGGDRKAVVRTSDRAKRGSEFMYSMIV